jgi:hypothetical protein
MARESKPIAEICLFGNQQTGAGWLARTHDDRLLGDGEPVRERSFTSALWLACQALEHRGYVGQVDVFQPSGRLVAETRTDRPGWYGELVWRPARQYVVSAEEVLAAGEIQHG